MSELNLVLDAVNGLKEDFNSYKDKMEIRVRALEDWKLSFVTKFTAYSAVALFFGSVIAQVGINFLNHYLTK